MLCFINTCITDQLNYACVGVIFYFFNLYTRLVHVYLSGMYTYLSVWQDGILHAVDSAGQIGKFSHQRLLWM